MFLRTAPAAVANLREDDRSSSTDRALVLETITGILDDHNASIRASRDHKKFVYTEIVAVIAKRIQICRPCTIREVLGA